MLKISLCDDDKRMLNQMEEMTNKYFIKSKTKATISRYTSGEELLAKANIEEIDILFLDIQMEGVNGLDVAEALRKVNPDAELIFITSYDQFMRYVFRYKASGYLSKPVEEITFHKILDQVTESIFKRGEKFYFKIDREERSVYKHEIITIESKDHNLLLNMENSHALFRGTIVDTMEQLGEVAFVQPNRSFIVNLNKVGALRLNEIIMEDGTVISISRTHREAVMETYFKFINQK